MTATRGKPATGQPKVLATYECDEGTRQLVAQRIKGKVAHRDVPHRRRGQGLSNRAPRAL
jgi:hypothetical protein